MKDAFVIKGGKSLFGTIDVRGSKNAALPIIAATILTKKKCKISNLPLVLDVYRMIEMLEQMGSNIRWTGKRSIEIENKEIALRGVKKDTVKKMRASVLLIGPLLARFGKVEKMQYPGGCSIGARPIDTHLKAFEDLGAQIHVGRTSFSVEIPRHSKISKSVILNEFSVTATENILMFLSSIPARTQIKIAASEPHVRDLARILSRMGARVRGAGTPTILVDGSNTLQGASHTITSDYIEAGTFILAALSTGGKVNIRNVPVPDLDFVIKKLISWGADIRVLQDRKTVEVRAPSSAARRNGRKMFIDRIQTLPHPGLPTDLQSAFGVLATQASGSTLIHEALYEGRLEYLKELRKMGAKVKVYDPHRAVIYGPSALQNSEVVARDLRGGAALIIAGLVARGETMVRGAEHVDRGYEDIDGRLRALGADIKRA